MQTNLGKVQDLDFGRIPGEPARVIRSSVPVKDFSFDIKPEQPATPQEKQRYANKELAVVEQIKEIKRKQQEVIELSDADLEVVEDSKPSVSTKAPPVPVNAYATKNVAVEAVDAPESKGKKKGGFWKKLRKSAAIAITGLAAMLGVGNAVKSQGGCDTTEVQAMNSVSNENAKKTGVSEGSIHYSANSYTATKIASEKKTPNSAPQLERIVKTGSMTSNGTGIGKQLFSYLMEGASGSQMKNLKQLQHEVQYGSMLDAKNIVPNSAEEMVALDTFRAFNSALVKARNGKSIHVTYKGESIPMSLDNPVIRRACEIRGIDCESKVAPTNGGGYEYYPNRYSKNIEKSQANEQAELAQIDAEWDKISANVTASVNKAIGLNAVR